MVNKKKIINIVLIMVGLIVVSYLAGALLPVVETALNSFPPNFTIGSIVIPLDWVGLVLGFAALIALVIYAVDQFNSK